MYLKDLKQCADKVEAFRESYKNYYRKHGFQKLDMTNSDLILYFIREKAYNEDIEPRYTLHKCTPGEDVHVNADAKKKIFDWLVCEFQNYFASPAPSSADEFDAWHQQTTETLVKRFNQEALKGYQPVKFGIGQKIVNMTFKYLSSCDNAELYANHFAYCHMVLDSKMIDWYYHTVQQNSLLPVR